MAPSSTKKGRRGVRMEGKGLGFCQSIPSLIYIWFFIFFERILFLNHFLLTWPNHVKLLNMFSFGEKVYYMYKN